MAEAVFDIVAEDPQEQHVAEQMQPAAMHEHGREDGHRVGAGLARKTAPGTNAHFGDELIAAGQLGQKDQHVEADQRERDDGKVRRWLLSSPTGNMRTGLLPDPCGAIIAEAAGEEVYRATPPAKDAEGGFSATVAGENGPRALIEGGRRRPPD